MAQVGLPFGAKKEPWMSPLETPCVAPPWGYLTGVDLRTQEVIWRRPLGTGYDHGPMGIPMSYEVDGRQYILAAVGGHERMETKLGDHVIAWALPAR